MRRKRGKKRNKNNEMWLLPAPHHDSPTLSSPTVEEQKVARSKLEPSNGDSHFLGAGPPLPHRFHFMVRLIELFLCY